MGPTILIPKKARSRSGILIIKYRRQVRFTGTTQQNQVRYRQSHNPGFSLQMQCWNKKHENPQSVVKVTPLITDEKQVRLIRNVAQMRQRGEGEN